MLYRLMILYQPAGESERTLILRRLQAPGVATSAGEAVQILRGWDRWFNRSQAIGIVPPDPYVLVKGLTGVCDKILPGMREASFRTSMLRSNLRLDQVPTQEGAGIFCRKWSRWLRPHRQRVHRQLLPRPRLHLCRRSTTPEEPATTQEERAARRAKNPCRFWTRAALGGPSADSSTHGRASRTRTRWVAALHIRERATLPMSVLRRREVQRVHLRHPRKEGARIRMGERARIEIVIRSLPVLPQPPLRPQPRLPDGPGDFLEYQSGIIIQWPGHGSPQ